MFVGWHGRKQIFVENELRDNRLVRSIDHLNEVSTIADD